MTGLVSTLTLNKQIFAQTVTVVTVTVMVTVTVAQPLIMFCNGSK